MTPLQMAIIRALIPGDVNEFRSVAYIARHFDEGFTGWKSFPQIADVCKTMAQEGVLTHTRAIQGKNNRIQGYKLSRYMREALVRRGVTDEVA